MGFHGSKEIPTPHLDKLATRSVRCTQGYVNHCFCSPIRAALLTGRYQHRFGHETNPVWNPEDTQAGLPLDQIMLPQLLAEAGYTTGMVGKWHLGAHPDFHPLKRGFQEAYVALGGGHVYFPGDKASIEYIIPMNRNGVDEAQNDYITTDFGKEAANFVKRHAAEDKPWFLYLPFNAPHTPLCAPEAWLEKLSHIQEPQRRTYAAMVASMDEAIGVVLDQLESTKQLENTIIAFISDNGGADLSRKKDGVNFTDNSPLRGAKGVMYEGGIRVPFLISYPTVLKPGTYTAPVISMDLFTTAAAVAGATLPQDRTMDGVNLLPYLQGEKTTEPHELLYWRRTEGDDTFHALRQDQWKLVKQKENAPELYDLSTDISETKNIAALHPQLVEELEAKRKAWSNSMMQPRFKNSSETKKERGKGKAKKRS